MTWAPFSLGSGRTFENSSSVLKSLFGGRLSARMCRVIPVSLQHFPLRCSFRHPCTQNRCVFLFVKEPEMCLLAFSSHLYICIRNFVDWQQVRLALKHCCNSVRLFLLFTMLQQPDMHAIHKHTHTHTHINTHAHTHAHTYTTCTFRTTDTHTVLT